jgi:bifunctional UDP-N-acetylglucosamine pyrophosphorylase/glucosamine-1-phosphate N-acetyltransferase
MIIFHYSIALGGCHSPLAVRRIRPHPGSPVANRPVDLAFRVAYNAAMADPIKAVVLAAGKSTRMKSELSKVLHPILGKEIIRYLLDSLMECGISGQDLIVVTGDNRAEIEKVIGSDVCYARQKEQLGTAHALLSASESLAGYDGDLLVLVGDNPYITSFELKKLIAHHRRHKAHGTLISAVFPDVPPPYGRIIRDAQGRVRNIVEEKDAGPEELLIREVNASIYLFDKRIVFPLLAQIGSNNAKHEYYLTDIVALLDRGGFKVEAVRADDCDVAIGINDRSDLHAAQRKFNLRIQRRLLLEEGVTILQPETVTIEHDVKIGRDTVIYPCTYLAAGTRIGKNCIIGPFAFLKNIHINDGEAVRFTGKQG